ncbi:hypothetical protein A0H81_14928 [Grifola frondosa]|uniref:Uncharacterized protein n=1 Tax=Grifola frondosa TaxID=5627 RepID=A0A1C7LM14_GRIFR|nr:hypothetical protein A0H81_14928 [Grifola frondosa]
MVRDWSRNITATLRWGELTHRLIPELMAPRTPTQEVKMQGPSRTVAVARDQRQPLVVAPRCMTEFPVHDRICGLLHSP